jgi:endonuclease YncB( thermonuclease family)
MVAGGKMRMGRAAEGGLVVALVGVVLMALPVSAREITGVPRIHDADTVKIGTVKIRLSGADAPENDQICLKATGERWACGITAPRRVGQAYKRADLGMHDDRHHRPI